MNQKRTTCPALVGLLSLTFLLVAQADEIDWDRAKVLRQKDRSGQSLNEEERAYLKKAMDSRRGRSATSGDGSDEVATVDPVRIPESVSPVKKLSATAADGNRQEVVYRSPKADRPLPAIVFIHGSLGKRTPRELTEDVLTSPTQTRLLAAGYVTVAATFRTYVEEPLSRGPILDVIAIIEEVKKLPEVDPESVVVFGTSGGGSIALELAGEPELGLVATVIGEPASILFTGLMTSLAMREVAMRDYSTLYNDERRTVTEAKIAAISCPILIHHGDRHPLKKINFDIVFPAIQDAGKTLVVKQYPGEDHGFYWGNRTSEATLESVVSNTLEFIEPLLKSPPATRSGASENRSPSRSRSAP